MPQSLKICYVADATNIHVQRFLGYFVERGHIVWCLSDKGGQIDGVNVITLPNRDSLLAAGNKNPRKMAVLRARGKAIKKILKEVKPDILHGIFLYQRGWSAAYTGYEPLLISLLGSDIYLPERHYRHGFQLWRDHLLNVLSLKLTDMVTAVSDDLYRVATRMTMGIIPVELIPIGTDPHLFKPDLEVTELREKLNIPHDAFVVLSPRQMTPHYNQEIIIQGIPRVLEEVPHAVFIMKDTFRNTEEREAYVKGLHDLADSLGVSEAIRWVEEVPLAELPQYYNLCDVVVSVPSTDGMPVTIFEAMACQKPIIVGDLPSYNEVIIHGQTGLRVPIRNPQVLARAVIKIHKQDAFAKRMVEESQVILHQYGIFYEQMLRMERYYLGLKDHTIPIHHSIRRTVTRLFLKLVVAFT